MDWVLERIAKVKQCIDCGVIGQVTSERGECDVVICIRKINWNAAPSYLLRYIVEPEMRKRLFANVNTLGLRSAVELVMRV